jgi:hypothetical protein
MPVKLFGGLVVLRPDPIRPADEHGISCLLEHSNRRRRVTLGVIEVGTKTDASI